MVIELVHFCIFWLNTPQAPLKNYLVWYKPHTLTTDEAIDYNRHCKLKIGEYVQNYEEHDNTMTS